MNKLLIPIVTASIMVAGSLLLVQGGWPSSANENSPAPGIDTPQPAQDTPLVKGASLTISGSIDTNVLITDFYGHRVVVVDRTDTTDSPQGTIIWQYGNVDNLYAPTPGAGHGIGPNQLFKPHTSAPLPNGNVLISDWGNHRIIEVDSNKNIVWQYGNANNEYNDLYTVAGNGTGFNQLYFPHDADRFADGTTLITDAVNHRVILVDMSKNILWQYGNFTPGSGYNQLNWPTHAHMWPNGNVLVADRLNHRVVEIDRTDLTGGPHGTIVWQYGTTGVSGHGYNQLYNVMNVIGLPNNNILVSDWYNHRVVEINKAKVVVWQYGVSAVSGTGPNYMKYPEAAYVISNGNTLISDVYNTRVIEIDRTNTTDSPNGTIVYQYGTTRMPGTTPGKLNYPPDAEEIVAAPPTVAGRHVFYNDCAFDGEDAAANADDDGAIAPDKTALLPGQTATFANYTSYSRGINGVMVDIANPGGTPTAADFDFRVGNDSNPAAWAAIPPLHAVTVRIGAGVGGSNRVTIIWPDNLIQKRWLQVTVKATAATGLASPDVFYFGNAIGETGDSVADARVTPTDQVDVRNNPHTLAHNPAGIDDAYDFNRDKKVGPTDEIAARNNGTNSTTALQLIAP